MEVVRGALSMVVIRHQLVKRTIASDMVEESAAQSRHVARAQFVRECVLSIIKMPTNLR